MGVPQESLLGPQLFSLYIDDHPSVHEDVAYYADDLIIYTHERDTEQVNGHYRSMKLLSGTKKGEKSDCLFCYLDISGSHYCQN